MSARSATSCGAHACAPRTRFASFCAEAIVRLAIATTCTPARAKPDASPVPTRPAPMKPSVIFFRGICYELYERSAGAVARGRQSQISRGAGSTPAARSRLSSTCPQPWTSTLSEVPNEKADRSPDAGRIRRHDSQRRSADARQFERQKKGQGQRQEGRSQELKVHRPSRAAQGQKGGISPPFCFCGYNRGPDPIRARLKSPHDDPTLPLASLSTRRPRT